MQDLLQKWLQLIPSIKIISVSQGIKNANFQQINFELLQYQCLQSVRIRIILRRALKKFIWSLDRHFIMQNSLEQVQMLLKLASYEILVCFAIALWQKIWFDAIWCLDYHLFFIQRLNLKMKTDRLTSIECVKKMVMIHSGLGLLRCNFLDT